MIFGVVLFSAGVKMSIDHIAVPPHEPGALLLAAGVAVLAVATAPLGMAVSAAAQLVALALLLGVVVLADRRTRRGPERREGRAQTPTASP